jgi:hypothetical protein
LRQGELLDLRHRVVAGRLTRGSGTTDVAHDARGQRVLAGNVAADDIRASKQRECGGDQYPREGRQLNIPLFSRLAADVPA